MGRSRESLVFARFSTTSDETKFARVARYIPKRLRSRLWTITHPINPPRFRGRERAATPILLRRHRSRHHDGVSHPVHDLFVGRNDGRQNSPQNDVPWRNHEVIRTKANPPSQNPDLPGLHIQVFLFEEAASIEPLQNIWVRG